MTLSGFDRAIFPYLTVSVGLRTERTFRYHDKHRGLQSTGCVHQLILESVESEVQLNRLVTAVTGERLLPPKDCFPNAVAEMSTAHLA